MTEFTAATVVQENIPELDGCPLLGQVRAYVVPGGALRTLEHIFRNANGQPYDLSQIGMVLTEDSISESTSEPDHAEGEGGHVWVRVREALSLSQPPSGSNPLYEVEAYAVHPSQAVVRFDMPPQLSNTPGVYTVQWAVKDHEGNVLLVDESCLLVERSLWVNRPGQVLGPPPFNQIRLSLRDLPEQNLLLQDYEFTPAEILQALTRPVAQWNESPPPVGIFNTTNFPFQEPWLVAAQAQLFEISADAFRRNRLPYSAGGLSIDDQSKEREYLAAAAAAAERYRLWVIRTKVARNAQLCYGHVGSSYSGWGYLPC